jgi:glycine cleavage system regulatory protein
MTNRTRVILTAQGSDRPGLTHALADAVHAAGGNWLESHLSRLGGIYVGSVLVELEDAGLARFEQEIRAIDARGLAVSLVPAAQVPEAQGDILVVELVGQDRPGIVREVTAVLERLGVNIEEFDSGTQHGSWSGELLFRARARLRLPAGLRAGEVREALEAISGEIMADFTFA